MSYALLAYKQIKELDVKISMSAEEFILFYSSYSSICNGLIRHLDKYGNFISDLAIKKVRLDNNEIRNIARNNSFLSVTRVPSLLIIYDDGDTQTVVGANKIIRAINETIARKNSRVEEDEGDIVDMEEMGDAKNLKVVKPERTSNAVDIEMVDDYEEPPIQKDLRNSPLSATYKPESKGKMESLRSAAKRMEEERRKTLGYSEKDLPKGS